MARKLTVIALLLVLAGTLPVWAQRITGSIVGTVTDPTGAVVASATATLTDPSHGLKRAVKANEMGKFEFPDLAPGSYKVAIEAAGFVTYVEMATVRVGIATPIEARLKVGAAATEVTVQGAAENVDTVRSTVQGIVAGAVIDSLPLNGRNFLDLAQQQPGIQVVDGGSFDPTKNGMAGISVGGRTGRVTRIQVDGVDITDETVGTTVSNISNEAIQEFNVAQSNLDPSTDMTSSGAVNIITRSGSNAFHGSGFFLFRDSAIAADPRVDKGDPITAKPPFRRKIMGGRAGGPFIKDKWFWHVEYERNQQARQTITSTPYFPQYSGAHPTPFNERMAGARTDFNVTNNVKVFYRFNHNWNNGVTGFGGTDLQAYTNLNNTNTHVVGVDYASGHFTHQARFSYVNFNNFIVGANDQAGTPLQAMTNYNVQISMGGLLQLGKDYLAPQATFQDNKQIKYDGSYLHGRHTIRFGAEVNWIAEGGFAAFFAAAPRMNTSATAAKKAFANAAYLAILPYPSAGASSLLGAGNLAGSLEPLNWPLTTGYLSNGLGYFSEQPGHGRPYGALYNNRIGLYAQDTIQVTRNLNVNIGLRWQLNTGMANANLQRASLIGVFAPELGGYPKRPNADFGPSAGFAWNVHGDGKTVIRGGAGLYYETNLFNSVMFDRPVNFPSGIGASYPFYQSGYVLTDPVTGGVLFNFATMCTNVAPGSNNCFNAAGGNAAPIALAAPFIVQADALYKARTATLLAGWPAPGAQPCFNVNHSTTGCGTLVATNYKTPYGIQANIGLQRELRKGLVLTVDYVRNHGVHFNMVTNWNRVGAADTLNVPAAQTAIAATLADYACADINCVITAGGSIYDFASFGLGRGNPRSGYAFGGNNRNFYNVNVINPIGMSTFQALQVALRGELGAWGFLKKVSTTINYQFGRFNTTLPNGDQDFTSTSDFNDRPTKFYGPGGIDRTHQYGFTFMVDLPWAIHLASTTSLRSNLPGVLYVPLVAGGAPEIFFTDLDGDGVAGDPLPGAQPGGWGRSITASNVNKYIDKYNANYVGQLTPAGQALVDAGLFTKAQLVSLGAVASNGTPISTAPVGQKNNPRFFNSDLRLSKTVKVTEHLNFEPIMEIFNVFNHANYIALSGLDGGGGNFNGTTNMLTDWGERAGMGSGSFSPGTQRAFQFGVRVNW